MIHLYNGMLYSYSEKQRNSLMYWYIKRFLNCEKKESAEQNMLSLVKRGRVHIFVVAFNYVFLIWDCIRNKTACIFSRNVKYGLLLFSYVTLCSQHFKESLLFSLPASGGWTGRWGLNREVRAALLRVKTGPECPEGNLRELMWDSNPNCGIAREGKKRS